MLASCGLEGSWRLWRGSQVGHGVEAKATRNGQGNVKKGSKPKSSDGGHQVATVQSPEKKFDLKGKGV